MTGRFKLTFRARCHCQFSWLFEVLLLGTSHLYHKLRWAVHNNQQVVKAFLFDHVSFELGDKDTFTNFEKLSSFGQLFIDDSLWVSIEDYAKEATHCVHDCHIYTYYTHSHHADKRTSHHTLIVENEDEIVAKDRGLLVGEQTSVQLVVFFSNKFKGPVKLTVTRSVQFQIDGVHIRWRLSIYLVCLHLQ